MAKIWSTNRKPFYRAKRHQKSHPCYHFRSTDFVNRRHRDQLWYRSYLDRVDMIFASHSFLGPELMNEKRKGQVDTLILNPVAEKARNQGHNSSHIVVYNPSDQQMPLLIHETTTRIEQTRGLNFNSTTSLQDPFGWALNISSGSGIMDEKNLPHSLKGGDPSHWVTSRDRQWRTWYYESPQNFELQHPRGLERDGEFLFIERVCWDVDWLWSRVRPFYWVCPGRVSTCIKYSVVVEHASTREWTREWSAIPP